MANVQKTSVASELALQAHLTSDPVLLKRLDQQNLWEVLQTLPGDFTKQDVLDFLKFRHSQLGELVQNQLKMSEQANPSEITPKIVQHIDQKNFLNEQDVKELANMITTTFDDKKIDDVVEKSEMQAKSGKFSMSGKESTSGKMSTPAGAVDVGAVLEQGQELADEADSLLGIVDAGLMQNIDMMLQQKNEEIKRELQRLVAMVKEGKIDAVFLLVAIAKVNCMKNGIIFTAYGKEYMNLNEEASKVNKDILGLSTTDPSAYSQQLQVKTQEQKAMGQQQTLLLQDMQKIMQNIESTMSFAKNTIDEVIKTRMQIVNAIVKGV